MRSHLQFGNQSRQMLLGVILALGLCSGAAHAQTVSLDGVSPIALTSSSVQSAVSINPATGNVIVRSSVGNYSTCSAPPPVTPTIISFGPNSSQVSPSSNITLNWSSTNTTSCSPQQGSGTIWASLGTLPTTGSQTFTAPANTGTINFQLTCTDGIQSVSQTTQVTVQPIVTNCPPAYPNGTQAEWNQVFNTWPAFGVRPRVNVPFNGYVSYRFTATSVVGQFGTVATSDYPGDGDGHGQMSISRDPGCFNAAQLGSNCLSPVTRFVSVGWANGAAQFSCSLTPGSSYYVNLTYGGNTSPGSGPYCPQGTAGCGADVQNQIQD